MAPLSKKKKIPKKTLVRLRLVEKLSIKAIAEKLGYSHHQVARQVRVDGIGQPEENLSKGEKAVLARTLRRLFVGERLPKAKIAAELNRPLAWVGIKLEQLGITRPAEFIKMPAGETRLWKRRYQSLARIRKMIKYYETPKTLAETALEFGISRGYVGILFKELGYQKRRRTATRKRPEPVKVTTARREKRLPKRTLENLYLIEQLDVSTIAVRLKVCENVIYRYLRYHRIPLRLRNHTLALKSGKLPINPGILRQQAQTMSIRELAEFYNRSYSAIQQMLVKYGIKPARKYPTRKKSAPHE